MSGLHSDRSPLPHAVREPGDVQHVHVGETVRGTLLQPLPQGGSLVVLRHNMSHLVAAVGEDRAVRGFVLEFKVLFHSFIKLAGLNSISLSEWRL